MATSDSTSSLPLYVVDASVAVKWHLRYEPDTAVADQVLDDFRDGRTELVASSHFRFEVASAIRNALRQGRETPAGGRDALTEFSNLRVPTVDDDVLNRLGFDLALRFGCSLFDGVYLALAEQLGCEFSDADNHLRNARGIQFPRALWLTNYVPHP